MEKNLTLPQGNTAGTSVPDTSANLVKTPLEWLRKYYSDVLGEEVGFSRMMRMLHAQAAFIMAALPVDGPLPLRAACCLWFLCALLGCKE